MDCSITNNETAKGEVQGVKIRTTPDGSYAFNLDDCDDWIINENGEEEMRMDNMNMWFQSIQSELDGHDVCVSTDENFTTGLVDRQRTNNVAPVEIIPGKDKKKLQFLVVTKIKKRAKKRNHVFVQEEALEKELEILQKEKSKLEDKLSTSNEIAMASVQNSCYINPI